ncbi:MAG: hypothetical protein CMD06_02615 [Flavobacteriales bacterium]|nr:hypothetical protein [Flavobacteriales bacterium]
MIKNLNLYRSSAGSGKTYTLAISYIKLSLIGYYKGDVKYYQRILAITFTNKAASEMKERILVYLFELSKSKDINGVLEKIKSQTSFDDNIIFEGARKIYHHIIHNYSNFSISTIDKFTTHIVRSFSRDLNMSYNFDLELDNSKIIEPVVALILNEVANDGGDLSDVLLNFSLSKIQEGKSSDIEQDLQQFSKEILKESSHDFINNDFNIKSCIDSKEFIFFKKTRVLTKITSLRNEVCEYFNARNISKQHFIRGTFYNYFTINLKSDDDKKWIPSETLQQNLSNNVWYNKNATQEVVLLIESCKEDLLCFFNKMMSFIVEYYSCKAILKNIFSLSILNELRASILRFKLENNIELLSDFNKKIHQIISNEPAAFIYERIGERYNHYLIDEFQDTSVLQWQNLLPLVVDSLDYGESFLVGDAKQSIYRWRGGQSEQFLQLPEIYKGDKLQFKDEWERKMSCHIKESNLDFNFRSRKEIVEFNNNFFKKTKTILDPSIQDMYVGHTQRIISQNSGGYVHIQLFNNDDKDYKISILEKIISEIDNLISNHNCSYNEIAILCNTSKKVSLVATYLSEKKIPVVSNDGLLLCSSPKVNFLISFLTFLNNPNDLVSRAAIVTYLYKYRLNNVDLDVLYTKSKDLNAFFSILKDANVYFVEEKLLSLPLYDMIERLIMICNIQEDIFTQFFLDFVFNYSKKVESNLPSFLRLWTDRSDKEAIVLPEGINAVQIMTIHKSKGLAFDNVFIPFNWEDTNKINDIWVNTNNFLKGKLPSALITSNSNLRHTYFADEYFRNKNLRLLDNLNKLYVAMTRARDRLYIFSKSFPSKIQPGFFSKGYLNSFLLKYSDNYPIITGNNFSKDRFKDVSNDVFIVKNRKKLNWRDIISIKHTASEIYDLKQKKIRKDWGKLFHNVLAEIHYLKDLEKVLNKLMISGGCTKDDYNKLKESLTEFFNSDEIIKYFSNDWYVKTEKEILMPNGKTYIPDRLLFKKDSDEVVVIDYKTGAERQKDKEQIIKYSDALVNMGFLNVKRILIYTNNKYKIKKV